jgi:hypothetical protein
VYNVIIEVLNQFYRYSITSFIHCSYIFLLFSQIIHSNLTFIYFHHNIKKVINIYQKNLMILFLFIIFMKIFIRYFLYFKVFFILLLLTYLVCIYFLVLFFLYFYYFLLNLLILYYYFFFFRFYFKLIYL